MRFLARLVLNGVAIIVAAWLLPGLHIAGPFPALIAGVILGFVNAIVRPILFVLTLPFTLITVGLSVRRKGTSVDIPEGEHEEARGDHRRWTRHDGRHVGPTRRKRPG